MNESKYQQLREVIIKANPEIMDLVFGCELERPDSERHYKVIEDIGFAANTKRVWVNSVPFGSMDIAREVEKDEILAGNGETWKIIGRPIRLADVLMALDKVELYYNEEIVVSSDGQIALQVNVDYESAYIKESSEWNFKDDNLDNQSDECKEFLYSLLVKQ